MASASTELSKYILRDDVRTHGSGNAGLTNFFRTFGGPLTFVVILTGLNTGRGVGQHRVEHTGGDAHGRLVPDEIDETHFPCWGNGGRRRVSPPHSWR